VQKRIALKGGVIHTSCPTTPRVRQFLIRERLVTEEQLFRAPRRRRRGAHRLHPDGGTILNEDDLGGACAKAEEMIYDLFLWPEEVRVKDGEMPANDRVHRRGRHGRDPEGVRRVDEWQRIARSSLRRASRSGCRSATAAGQRGGSEGHRWPPSTRACRE
jgi:hypothetical protein